MADVALVNVAASQIVSRGSVLRITFAERYSIQLDSGFAQHYRDDVYANIASTHLLYPIVADGAIDGNPSAVTDCRVSTDVALSSIVGALNDLSPWFVQVTKVQLLTPNEAATAPQTSGADARQSDTDTQNKLQDASNPLVGIGDFLSKALAAGEWIAVAALAGLAVWYLWPYLKRGKHASK